MYMTLIKSTIRFFNFFNLFSFLLYTLFIVVRTAKFVPRKNWVVTGSVSYECSVLIVHVLKIMH